METDENAVAHAHLRQLLLQQIEGQEKTNSRYKKILNRMTVITIGLSVCILGECSFIIYTINKPDSHINELRNEVKGLETRTYLLRSYIDIDKKELDLIHKNLDTLTDSTYEKRQK